MHLLAVTLPSEAELHVLFGLMATLCLSTVLLKRAYWPSVSAASAVARVARELLAQRRVTQYSNQPTSRYAAAAQVKNQKGRQLPHPIKLRALQEKSESSTFDQVEFCAFSPENITPQQTIAIEILLRCTPSHAQHQENSDFETIVSWIKHGAEVELHLESDLIIHAPVQSITWRGVDLVVVFVATAPSASSKMLIKSTLRAMVENVPIGIIPFSMQLHLEQQNRITGNSAETNQRFPEFHDSRPVAVGKNAIRYTKAFLSYADEDRELVSVLGETLEFLNIDVIFDRFSFKLGENWQASAGNALKSVDLVIACWSKHAARSEPVAWELQEAEKAKQTRPSSMDIVGWMVHDEFIALPPMIDAARTARTKWALLRPAR